MPFCYRIFKTTATDFDGTPCAESRKGAPIYGIFETYSNEDGSIWGRSSSPETLIDTYLGAENEDPKKLIQEKLNMIAFCLDEDVIEEPYSYAKGPFDEYDEEGGERCWAGEGNEKKTESISEPIVDSIATHTSSAIITLYEQGIITYDLHLLLLRQFNCLHESKKEETAKYIVGIIQGLKTQNIITKAVHKSFLEAVVHLKGAC